MIGIISMQTSEGTVPHHNTSLCMVSRSLVQKIRRFGSRLRNLLIAKTNLLINAYVMTSVAALLCFAIKAATTYFKHKIKDVFIEHRQSV